MLCIKFNLNISLIFVTFNKQYHSRLVLHKKLSKCTFLTPYDMNRVSGFVAYIREFMAPSS